MANKRSLKRNINLICTDLLADCVAISLYGSKKNNEEDLAALLHSIVKLEDEYIRRVSHVEPGMDAKDYFKDLADKFNKAVTEIVDQINYLN